MLGLPKMVRFRLETAQKRAAWNQAIDAKVQMTAAEQAAYADSDDLGRIKTLKKVARRVEAEVTAMLEARGFTTAVRFDPKTERKGIIRALGEK